MAPARWTAGRHRASLAQSSDPPNTLLHYTCCPRPSFALHTLQLALVWDLQTVRPLLRNVPWISSHVEVTRADRRASLNHAGSGGTRSAPNMLPSSGSSGTVWPEAAPKGSRCDQPSIHPSPSSDRLRVVFSGHYPNPLGRSNPAGSGHEDLSGRLGGSPEYSVPGDPALRRPEQHLLSY